ncbi:hypothetical protein M433DRAFT_515719 [Acidomyces richmondensis BFW]|nr:MAG: hypothetical protein FE78DRAFT_29714 [Acidomyces sp. 'richmondensis']KYG47124.1 hypothetical protein M433DRAFT_515719 [Acidomyces richmondensis BFW]
MEYETEDGSHFYLQEIWEDDEGRPTVSCMTSVTALVDGKAYAGLIEKDMGSVEDEEVLSCLRLVPPQCIYPPFSERFTQAPTFDPDIHYLKTPSFTYADCKPGITFVADCFLREVVVLEQLKANPHPNLVNYIGCIVRDGRIYQLCLQKYRCNLHEYIRMHDGDISKEECYKILDGIESGLDHIHALGFAHNDINPYNICIDKYGEAIIVDFDSCLPFGEALKKGSGAYDCVDETSPISQPENDLQQLDDIAEMLLG